MLRHGAGGRARGHHRRGRHRLLTWPNSWTMARAVHHAACPGGGPNGASPTRLKGGGATPPAARDGAWRQVTLLQRKKGKLGGGLGKTTGWIHPHRAEDESGGDGGWRELRAHCRRRARSSYGEKRRRPDLIPATPWSCAPARCLCANWRRPLEAQGRKPHPIGGALETGELDANAPSTRRRAGGLAAGPCGSSGGGPCRPVRARC